MKNIKKKVIFICIHNSARSQIAEGYLKTFAGKYFDVFSAGLEAGKLNSVVVEAMKEDHIDISHHKVESIDCYIKNQFDYVITVCDETSAERCPLFPGGGKRLHWSFPDPSSLVGENKLAQTIEIREMIKSRVLDFIKEFRV